MKKRGKGEMTVSEMGRLGGLARAAKCTPEQMSAIGRLGVAAMKAKYSPEERRELLSHRRTYRRLTEKKIARIKKLFKSGWNQTRIAEALGSSRPTIGRHLHRGRWRKTAK